MKGEGDRVNPRLLAHNRVFEEYAPAEPTLLQRLYGLVAPYGKFDWRTVGVARWAPQYTRDKFWADFAAACIIAVVLVPQSMAYAVLAGLDPVYGLYSSTIPLLVYSFFTSSSQVAPGPVAPTAVLMEGIVRSVSGAAPRTAEFTRWHILLAFTTGLFQLLLGSLRFGWVADLLSWPVMSGFASGAACIIVVSQLGDFMGLKGVARETSFFMRLYRAVAAFDTANAATSILGLLCFWVLLTWREWTWPPWPLTLLFPRPAGSTAARKKMFHKMFPMPLLLMALATLLSFLVDLNRRFGVKTVGFIPSELPLPGAPVQFGAAGLEDLQKIASSAALLAVINYVQTVSLAVLFGKKVGETVNGSSEMFALGTSSVIGSCFQCYTVAGSFTRTVIQHEAGARTPAAVTFTGLLMVIFILTLTRLLPHLPITVLAAIVLASTKQLFGWKDAVELWRAKKSDFAQLFVTFFGVLVLDIMYGLILGVAFSLGMVLYRCFSPRIAELGRLPGTDTFVARDRFPVCQAVPGIAVLRLDGELHFGNVRVVTDKLYELLDTAKRVSAVRAEQAAREEEWSAAAATAAGGGRTPLMPDSGVADPQRGAASDPPPAAVPAAYGARGDGQHSVAVGAEHSGSAVQNTSNPVAGPSGAAGSSAVAAGPSVASTAAVATGASVERERGRGGGSFAAAAHNGQGVGVGVGGERKARLVYALSVAMDDPKAHVRQRARVAANLSAGGQGEPQAQAQVQGGAATQGGRASSSGRGRQEPSTASNASTGPVDAHAGHAGIDAASVVVLQLEEASAAAGGSALTGRVGVGLPPAGSSAMAASSSESEQGSESPYYLNSAGSGFLQSLGAGPLSYKAAFGRDSPLRAVILDGSRVVDIDSTACRELQGVMEAYHKAKTSPKVTLLFAALPGPVRDTLDAFGVTNSVDPATTRFLSIPAAIASIYERQDLGEDADGVWEAITHEAGVFEEDGVGQRQAGGHEANSASGAVAMEIQRVASVPRTLGSSSSLPALALTAVPQLHTAAGSAGLATTGGASGAGAAPRTPGLAGAAASLVDITQPDDSLPRSTSGRLTPSRNA